VLTVSRGLDDRSLSAVRALEREVVAHDGGRLKLEHGVLEAGNAEAAMWWHGDRLLGFAGVYAFGGVEIAGMVAPAARRAGIGTALLDAALETHDRVLLVTPSTSEAGRAFALQRGAHLDHSEHFLVLGETPAGAPLHADVTLRRAEPADTTEVRRMLAAAFDWEPPSGIDWAGDSTYVIERAGTTVGTVRLSAHADAAGVYGFAVDPSEQGRGIGRDVLGRVCRKLRDEGHQRVTLEVETQNENALRLYTSTGFVREAGEDYWVLGG
jgi:ribosomal protein S18 acetylase RimI-like enzyme